MKGWAETVKQPKQKQDSPGDAMPVNLRNAAINLNNII
jgi:hypothetical protein